MGLESYYCLSDMKFLIKKRHIRTAVFLLSYSNECPIAIFCVLVIRKAETTRRWSSVMLAMVPKSPYWLSALNSQEWFLFC